MGLNNINLKKLIKVQLENEKSELLDLINEIESLTKIIEQKKIRISEKQNSITILENLINICKS